MPKVSILMPVYNSAEFLREAIESMLSQSFKDFEFLIVDDGSTDGSAGILAEYVEKDSRIRIIRNEKNQGIVYSLNRGLKECTGEYIARMDSDDIALKERLDKQIAVLDKNPDIIALGGAISYIDSRGNELGVIRRCTVDKSLITQNPLLHPAVMLRRETLERSKLAYMEKYRYAEDYFLWLQLSRLGKLGALDDIVIKYRLSKNVTRMMQLKKVLWATIKVKTAGMFKLGIRPGLTDLLRFIGECVLLLLPLFIVRFLYLRVTFGKGVKVIL